MSIPVTNEVNGGMGINNIGDPLSLGPDYLVSATNVDIGDTKLKHRREGYGAALLAGNYHSAKTFFGNTLCLAVTGTSLRIVNPDWSSHIIRNDLTPGLRMSYVEVNDEIHYTNSQVIGFVKNRADGAFPAITKIGGSRMPAGHLIEYHNGVLLVARGGDIFHSMPHDLGRTELRRNFFSFPGRMTLMRSVFGGLFVAYGKTSFLAGLTPKEFTVRDLTEYDAIPHTDTEFDAADLGGDQPMTGKGIFWESTKGPCIGLPGGIFFNLALNKYTPPAGASGASIQRVNRKGFNQFLTILQGG